ncbi:hypothetical protein ACSV5M_20300 [Cellvibrio sp. ARAG 10.3]|uniref:hypothetical protein n=1 Tax=Cellvibrio sp. ARAG 10.3 TaxID=3451358 RepID=UPI003F44D95F
MFLNKDTLIISVWLLTLFGLFLYITFLGGFFRYVEKVQQDSRAKANLLKALFCFSMASALSIIAVVIENDPLNEMIVKPVLYASVCGFLFFGLISIGLYIAFKRYENISQKV